MPNESHARQNVSSTSKATVTNLPAPVGATASEPLFAFAPISTGASLSPAAAVHLQHAVGNRAVTTLLSRSTILQTKLQLGPAGDRYEQEADQVAQQVVRQMDGPKPVQRVEDDEEEELVQTKPFLPQVSRIQRHADHQDDDEEIMRKVDGAAISRLQPPSLKDRTLAYANIGRQNVLPKLSAWRADQLQRHPHHDDDELQRAIEEEDEPVQLKPSHGLEGGEVDSSVAQEIQSSRGGGRPMDDQVRGSMEQGFGADFSGVRIHTGGRADALNRSLNARAFTVGSDVFFRHGEYNPGNSGGKQLLAHELTHTIQQGAAPAGRSIQAQREDRAKSRKHTMTRNAVVDQLQRDDVQSSVAKIIDAGVNVTNSTGGVNQVGHAMDVWVDIDAGDNSVTPASARPNTVYGLELEYWEYVNVPNDNQGATGEKPWNDIYAMKPDATTFGKAAGGCDKTWSQAVSEAAAGTLKGKHRIGFQDIPGLIPKAGRNVERTLKFRIIFNDGNQRREIFATQLLRMNNGQMGYSAYTDTVGNNVESHGFGTHGYQTGSVAEQQALGRENNKLTAAGLPSKAEIMNKLSTEAKSGVQTFVAHILQGTAVPFIDEEMIEWLGQVAGDKQAAALQGGWSGIAKNMAGDLHEGVASGNFMVPSIQGTKRVQMPVTGGLLVAIVNQNRILRMYFTDNTKKAIDMGRVQGGGQGRTVHARSFAEIPTEIFQQSFEIAKSVSTHSTTKPLKLNAKNAHLRDFTQQGANYIVKVKKQVGAQIKQDGTVNVFEPEVRDITGEWVKAKFGAKTGFIRISKLTGLQDATNWKKKAEGAIAAPTGGKDAQTQAMAPYFERELRARGSGYAVYGQLLTQYKGFEEILDTTYKNVFDEPRLIKAKVDLESSKMVSDVQRFAALARRHNGNHAGMINDVMLGLKRRPGKGDDMETVYNQHVPPLGLNVPATLGDIVSTHFMNTFRQRGSGYAVYNELLKDYPDFDYRLKPAYRHVFGEDQLKTMMKQRQDAEFAEDVPDPDSMDNLLDWINFKQHGLFTQANFSPKVGNTDNKFDVEFDPKTNKLKLIVKIAFEFADGDVASNPVSPEADPTSKFGRGKWTDPDKDDYKQRYKASTVDVFNNSGIKISCIKPGWEDIVVTPQFEIREVPAGGGEHFVSRAGKSYLSGTGAGKKMMKGQAGARPGFQAIYETDVHDKLRDPSVHAYLHQAEKEQNIEPAYKLDRQRLEKMLAQYGTITSPVVDSIRRLVDNLKRLSIPSDLAHLHPLEVHVETSDANQAQRFAQGLKARLQQSGVGNPILVHHAVNAQPSFKVIAAPEDPAVKQTYVNSWSRLTAAHEFGHMIGLIDEYYEASSADSVKMMISAGFLPPGTRGDHLKLNPPKSNMAKQQAQKQTDQMKALKRAGIESPDLAMDAPGSQYNKDPKSTSLMSGGYRVEQQHFLSAWEALAEVTKTYVAEKFWKIT
jgi:hypothetical protein